ncbi:MAG: hypothetical protein WCF22_12315 [Candidatus Sulfotelmatobacter sp.]
MPIFTVEEREHLRSELVSAARNDPNLAGAAHTGSFASSRVDRWSDIDLALCLKPAASHEEVVAKWTDSLYRDCGAVAHVDVRRGATLFRVFLLENTLQVDIAFWREEDFAALGPSFRLIFGQAGPTRAAQQPNPLALIGMAWLYALHVRSSLARDRVLQAEYMLTGMRNHVCDLMCLRSGVTAHQGRGLDDLSAADRNIAAACIPQSLESSELKRAFGHTVRALLKEVQQSDRQMEARLAGPLKDLCE